MPVIPSVAPEGVSYPRLGLARGDYSFAADGGAVGDIVLEGDYIPSGSTILGGWVEVTGTPTSGGNATIAIKVEGANDIVSAAAFDGAPWSSTGRKSVVPVFTGATTVRTSADRRIVATVGTAALTAGAFKVVLVYVPALG